MGVGIHRAFAEAVAWDDGKLRRLGRVDMRRDLLAGFAEQLSEEDVEVVEATGNAAAVTAVIAPHVKRVARFDEPQKLVSYLRLNPSVRQSGRGPPITDGSPSRVAAMPAACWSRRLGGGPSPRPVAGLLPPGQGPTWSARGCRRDIKRHAELDLFDVRNWTPFVMLMRLPESPSGFDGQNSSTSRTAVIGPAHGT